MANKKLYVHLANGMFTHITGTKLNSIITEAKQLYPGQNFSVSYIEKKPSPFNGKMTDHFTEVFRNY